MLEILFDRIESIDGIANSVGFFSAAGTLSVAIGGGGDFSVCGRGGSTIQPKIARRTREMQIPTHSTIGAIAIPETEREELFPTELGADASAVALDGIGLHGSSAK